MVAAAALGQKCSALISSILFGFLLIDSSDEEYSVTTLSYINTQDTPIPAPVHSSVPGKPNLTPKG